MPTPAENLQLAKRGPIVSIIAYLTISIAKLIAGYTLNSSSLIADGFNNLSDILGNVALLIGLHLASKPADAEHRFGHWKIEDLASLITSFIMFIVGFQCCLKQFRKSFLEAAQPLTQRELSSVSFQLLLCMVFMFTINVYHKR